MIIFFDLDKQEMQVYNKDGMALIPFINAHDLLNYVDGSPTYYITNAIEVDVQDIFNTLDQIGVHQVKSSPPLSTNKYIHTIQNGTLYVDDTLKFEGKFDVKVYDESMEKVVKSNPIIQKLIQKKEIEIISESRRISLMNEFKNTMKKQEDMKKKSDQRLDDIILKKKVSDFDPDDQKDDIISIDITDDVIRGRSETEEERLTKEIMRG